LFEKILFRVTQRPLGAPFVIGINGIDASGKTMFSKDLAGFLIGQGYCVQLVHVDDFHKPKKFRYKGHSEAENYYYRSIDFERLVRDLLDPIVQKQELDVELTLLDLNSDQYTLSRRYVVNRNSIVIVEGVFLFKKDLLEYFDFKIFLDISFSESVRRALARDEHIPAGQVEDRYAEKYHAGQKLYFRLHDPKGSADITINNEDYLHPIWRFWNRLEPDSPPQHTKAGFGKMLRSTTGCQSTEVREEVDCRQHRLV